MKKFIQIIPVAFAALAMTSCSNDDFFGFNGEEEDGITLTANVPEEIAEDGVTRAARASNGSGFQWNVGDELRVYDSKLQKYDVFTMKEGKTFFTLKGAKQYVTEKAGDNLDYSKAIFIGNPTGEISYGGWQPEGDNGVLTALVNIPSEITYKETNSKYISALPMWGDVTPSVGTLSEDTKSFETNLAYLSGQAKVIFKNGTKNATLAARAHSLRFATAADVAAGTLDVLGSAVTAAGIATPAEQTAIKTALESAFKEGGLGFEATATIAGNAGTKIGKCLVANQDAPLSGWFEARLEEEGYIQDTDNSAVKQPADRSFVRMNLAQANMKEYENVVFLPLAPQTYDLIVIEYSEDNGTTWKPMRAKFDYTVEYKGNGQFSNLWNATLQTKAYTLSYDIDGLESTYEIGRYMSMYNSANGSVELNLEGNFATISGKLPEMYTIYVPQLNHDMVVNITKDANDFLVKDKELVIADADGVTNFDKKVTINFQAFDGTSAKNVQIKTKRPIEITGDFSHISDITAANSSKLILGTEDKDITNVADVILAKADGETAVTEVEVNGGATDITKITNTDGVDLTINGGEVATVQLVKNAAQTITMTGGNISTKIAKPAADLTASFKVTVNTSGAALIKDAETKTTSANKLTYEFNSTYTAASATAGIAANEQANIYTAAQLASVGKGATTAFTLQTNVTVSAPFTSLAAIAGLTAFDGNNMTITNLNAPLFGALATTAAVTIKKLKIVNPTIATAANIGTITSSITKSANLQNIEVTGATLGAAFGSVTADQNAHTIGGLVGSFVAGAADQTLAIQDCSFAGTIQGYYNLGGFIGLAGHATNKGTVTITKTNDVADAGTYMSNVVLKKSYWKSDANDNNCGKVGNFIGSLNALKALTIGNGGKAKTFAKFFSANSVTAETIATANDEQARNCWLEFGRNKSGETTYQGMENQLFGFSTAIPDAITVFGMTKVKDGALVADGTTGAVAITLNNYINIFE